MFQYMNQAQMDQYRNRIKFIARKVVNGTANIGHLSEAASYLKQLTILLGKQAGEDGPCFDPTCGCCRVWQELDDSRLADIERLQELRDGIKISHGTASDPLLSLKTRINHLEVKYRGQNPPN